MPQPIWSWGPLGDRPTVALDLLRLKGPQGSSGFPGPLKPERTPLNLSLSPHLFHQHSQYPLSPKVGLGANGQRRDSWREGGAPQVGIWLWTQGHQGWEWRREWWRLRRIEGRWGWLEASRSPALQHTQRPWRLPEPLLERQPHIVPQSCMLRVEVLWKQLHTKKVARLFQQ